MTGTLTEQEARKAAEHGRPVILSQLVASNTQWGADIAKNPWVRVVASRHDLELAVDEIAADPSAVLLRDLGLVS